MEPILSKQEIADLLSSLQQGSRAGDADADTGIVAAGDSGYGEIDLFQLHRGRHEPEQIPNFDIIMELFGEYFRAALAHYLQRSVEIALNGVEYQRFNTYLVLESHPAAIGQIRAEPLKFDGLITLSPELAFPLLEMLTGGSPLPDSSQPNRAATKIELSVLRPLMERGCRALQEALIPVVSIDAKLVKTTHDRRLVSLVKADAEIVVCSLHVQVEHHAGTMQLVFPTQSFMPYRESLENLLHLDDIEAGGWLEPLSDTVDLLPCTVMAQAAAIDMTIRDLIDLRVGDVLTLPCRPGSRVKLLVEGKHKYSGFLKMQDHKRCIYITGIAG